MSRKPQRTPPGPVSWQLISLTGLLTLLFLPGCAGHPVRQSNALLPLHFDPPELSAPYPAGPTLRLDYSGGPVLSCPIADFMYLIPLISPEPLSMTTSPGNTQRIRVTRTARRVSADTFSIAFGFELIGKGSLRNEIDHAPNIQRNAQKLRDGGVIERALHTMTIDGAGAGGIEVEGAITNGLASVTEVRVRFSARGRPSPVSIEAGDLRVTNGVARVSNEHIARVNALTFRRGPEPRMGVTIASLRRKDGGEGLWSKIVGLAANLVIKPIKVDATGYEAMLNFGRQLAAEAPSFTFPRAKNLKDASGTASAVSERP